MSEDVSIIDEIEGHYQELFGNGCRGCHQPWPCAVHRAIVEIRASRKKLAAIREIVHDDPDDWSDYDPAGMVDEIMRAVWMPE